MCVLIKEWCEGHFLKSHFVIYSVYSDTFAEVLHLLRDSWKGH